MKVGDVPLIWPVIGVMFWRWFQLENTEPAGPEPAGSQIPAGEPPREPA